MPTILETDIGEFEFANDLTIDQINEWGRTELPNLRQRVSKGVFSDLASRFPRDVATAGADTLMGAVRGWQQLQDYGQVRKLRQMGTLAAISAPLGEESAAIQASNAAADAKAKELEATREQRLQESTLYQFGLEAKANAQEFYKTNPTREGSIPAMLSQGLASTVPVIASGVAGPLAPVVAGVTYGAQAGQQGAQEAIERGQPEKADEAFILFAGLGALSEAALGYPIAFLRQIRAARQAGVDPAQFGRTFRQQAVRQGAEGFAREALQEGTEQAGQNVIASDIVGYDPERPLMQGVPQAAAIGGVVGGGIGAVGGAAMAIDEARARSAAGVQVPAMLREVTAPEPFVPDSPVTPEQRAAEAAGLPIPLFPETSGVATPATELTRESPAPTPEPAPPAPRRRSPATLPSPTVARPATVAPSEASAGLTALPVGEETGPTTRSDPPPARAEEGARETGIPSTPVVAENAPTPTVAPISTVQPEAQQRGVGLPEWAREEMLRRGLDPNRPLNDVDIANPSVREAIATDPTLTPEQKANILATGSPVAQPQGTPNAGTIRSPETLPLRQQTQTGQEVVAQIRDAERPAVPQAETPQAQGAVDPTAKYSVTLSEPTGAPAVTPLDIEAAFPASQGFEVRPVSMTMVGPDGSERISNSFLIKLPNGQGIIVDPTLETIHFDPTKAAADWGLDPQAVAERGVARGVYRSGGAQISGLSRVGLIELLRTSGPASLSHEKFHALFDMALTTDERAVILNRYKTEEKAAEAFRRSEGFTRTFWEKIKRFLEWLSNLVRGDAFRKLRAPLSTAPSQPTGRTEPQYSLERVLRSPEELERFLAKPFLSEEEKLSLRQQAGAGAGLVPDAIAKEVEALKAAPAETVEGRMATLLEFVLQLHGVAPALELQRILSDTTIAEDTKQAAISNVLRQIEHVRAQTNNLEEKLQEANAKLGGLVKKGGKITAKRLVEARSKQIADNLISRYRSYLTAQAANLPANQNLAAARAEMIQGMRARLDRNQSESPDSMWKAIERIAERISELPVSQGPIAVTEAIRQKGILRDVAGDPTIDLLTAEKPGGLAPLLASPEAGQMLQELADLQKKAETYSKQIEVIEQAFRGKDEPTPVELKKFADTYRKFRNQQTDAAKAIREYDKDFQKADEDVQVYGGSLDILNRLQDAPQFKDQLKILLARPGGEILSDIYQTAEERKKDPTKETVFLSPLTQKPFRVHLSPTRQADNDTLRDMGALKTEIDEFLKGENVDPLERQTWEIRRAYIEQYQLHPQYLQEDAGGSLTNPFQWGRVLFGGLTSSLRAELEALGIRAAQEADTQVRVAEHAAIGYKLLANNKEFGDAATVVATIEAVKSHNWPTTRILHWNQYVLNPILASGQAAGQMRLKSGDYIPGTDIQITPQDMAVARMEKRFSSGIVQTTQGTAKGLPAILRHNPVLITDTALGKPVLRGALSPGPLTMARSFSTWGRQFDIVWSNATTPEAQRRLVNDGDNFQMAALGYVRTTNPEFQNDSPLLKVYEQYAKNSKENNQYSANSFDQLVDHLADIAVAQQLYQTKGEAKSKIESILMSEIGNHVAAIRAQFAEDKINPQVHQTVMQYASAQNAFTKARKRMVAPDPYYDYTLTHESDRISFVGAGFQQFQLRVVASLEALQTALGIQQTQWDSEIRDLYSRGGTEAEARAKVNKKTVKQIGDVRFSYEQLLDYKRRLDKLIKQLKELVIDVRDPNDSLLLQAVTRFHQTLSSGLLANPTAIGNNLAGGIMSAKQVTLRNLGQAQSFWNPKAHARMAGAVVKSLLRIFPGTTAIGKLARSNIPVVEDLSGWVHDMLLEQIKQESDAESFGLRTTTDLRNRSRARGELMPTAGQIEYDKPGAVAGAVNVLGSLPVVRQTMAHLRDKIPGAFDRWMNTNNARFYQDTLFENLKVRAIKAFEAREQIAARTGVGLSRLNDFTREENLLTPKELEMPKFSGYRDSGRLRQLFSTVGSLDKFLLDYYNRWKAAPANEKANVPLFPDEADMGAVLHEIESHENLATAGFTPLSMQGVGQRGLIKKVLFMFRNYPTRMFTQMARLLATDPRDPKGWREAYGWWSVLVILIVSAIAGMIGKEVASPIQQAITGRSPSYVKLSNVMENPDAGMVARYVGMALASNLPYYGGVISQILGNPGYGTWLDAAEYIPVAGLVKDAGGAVRRMSQTGDAILPGADFVGRWFPPASPALRLLPSVSGDIERRNAERALRVVGPSAGMELAGGGGGNATQTPASAAVRRLISAAYRGDREGIQQAFDEAVREKTAQGSPDPERAVLQSLASSTPARRVYGKSITPAEEAQLTGLMSGAQRADYSNAQNAFSLINQTLGTQLKLTSEPRARTRGQASRRALFTDRATPIFATRRSRRRRLGGSRGSAFRRLQIRGSSRRRRRSPARVSFSA